jgi:hypothetical protein
MGLGQGVMLIGQGTTLHKGYIILGLGVECLYFLKMDAIWCYLSFAPSGPEDELNEYAIPIRTEIISQKY